MKFPWQKSNDGYIDRNPQNLPISIGGTLPEFVQHRTAKLPWKTNYGPAALSLLGIGLGLVGAILGAGHQHFEAWKYQNQVNISGNVLNISSSGFAQGTLYQGDGVLILEKPTPTSQTALSSFTFNSQSGQGKCVMDLSAGVNYTETCNFNLAGKVITATDSYDVQNHLWKRVYSNHASLNILVPSDKEIVPIPFLVGYQT